ncbi:unnamed protein product [Orchesella dallaii]|uniref:Peptidase metallopeptidase domain-containing protein n=1 Tax=Orchesella dallaii TaxID=48710 RepID=A0ABP1S8B2_9HEXA
MISKCNIVENLPYFLIFLTSVYYTITTSHACDTPADWLSGDALIQKGIGYLLPIDPIDNQNSSPKLWQYGIVKYKLHQSLTSKDKIEVQKAFDEYHRKTCVRFQPWTVGDPDFVSIEVNNNVCGKAHVCKIGGYQFATFGKNCRNMSTMVHQLGHTLCLGHRSQPGENTGALANLMEMGDINALYKCKGECHRHIWVPVEALIHADKENMYTFGYKTKDGFPIYPCRAQIGGEITAGIYNDSGKTCRIAAGSRVHDVSSGVEVLTIPGGLRQDCNIYTFVDSSNVLESNAIQVGISLKNNQRTSYIAFGSISDENEVIENSIGNVWLYGNNKGFDETDAEVLVGGIAQKLEEYKVLSCSLDTACMLTEWYEDMKN